MRVGGIVLPQANTNRPVRKRDRAVRHGGRRPL